LGYGPEYGASQAEPSWGTAMIDAMVPCPTCGAPSIPVAYGMPGPDMIRAVEAGQIALGGCMPGGPRWTCTRSEEHDWAGVEEVWEQALDDDGAGDHGR
jgi:hypothetical protein